MNKQDPSPECYASQVPATEAPINGDPLDEESQADGSSNSHESDCESNYDADSDNEEDGIMDNDSEEVSISVDPSTHGIVPTSSQVSNYIGRGTELESMSLWDFVAQSDKVIKGRNKRPSDESSDTESECESESLDEEFPEHESNLHRERSDKHLKVDFMSNHDSSGCRYTSFVN